MIALDTNVLVRFLVGDDPEQSGAARRSLEALGPGAESGFVPDLVLAEIAWVLRSVYRLARPEIADALRSLASADHLAFEDNDRLSRTLTAFEGGRGDFSDYLIREQARGAGCASVLTFDRELMSEDGFSAPG